MRDSGAIEQDADVVMMIHRPAYYGARTAYFKDIEKDTKGLMIANIAKNRNGATGEIELIHNESVTEIHE